MDLDPVDRAVLRVQIRLAVRSHDLGKLRQPRRLGQQPHADDGDRGDHDDEHGDKDQRFLSREPDVFLVKFILKGEFFCVIFHICIIQEKNCFHKQKSVL